MAKIDSAYAYYLSTYVGTRQVSRYETHKRSELRKVYNEIVKSNKDAPLVKLSDPETAKRYAIDIKESAKTIKNVVASLSDGDTLASSFQKKVAVSSDEESVVAQYVGENQSDANTEPFTIEVLELAKPQINQGKFIDSKAFSLTPGTYSFDLNTSSATYEFQYAVSKGDTNLDVQKKLAKLVNQSNLGIRADIVKDEKGYTALTLTSKQTGLTDDETELFSIFPGPTPESLQAMNLLGITEKTQEASNSAFLLNGVPRSSYSNTFTINHELEITLKGVSPKGNPATIGYKANLDAVADNINSLVKAYNGILDVTANYSSSYGEKGGINASKLHRDISGIAMAHREALSSIGLNLQDDDKLSLDTEVLEEAITPERLEDTLHILEDLKNAIGKKAEKASIDPMSYVNKVVVAYKNPGRTFATPYVTSIYSGMIMDWTL